MVILLSTFEVKNGIDLIVIVEIDSIGIVLVKVNDNRYISIVSGAHKFQII